MIIIKNVDNKETTEYRTTFFNITKRNTSAQTTMKGINKRLPSTFGTSKKQ